MNTNTTISPAAWALLQRRIGMKPTITILALILALLSAPHAHAAQTVTIYDAPNGRAIGQAALDRLTVPRAHCGDAWSRPELIGYGFVWIVRADVPGLPVTGVELCPRRPVSRGAR